MVAQDVVRSCSRLTVATAARSALFVGPVANFFMDIAVAAQRAQPSCHSDATLFMVAQVVVRSCSRLTVATAARSALLVGPVAKIFMDITVAAQRAQPS